MKTLLLVAALAVLGGTAAQAAAVNIHIGARHPVHHRHQVCTMHHHHRVCSWR